MTAAAAREAKRKKDDLFFNYSMSSSIGYKQMRLGRNKDATSHFTKAIEFAEEGKALPLVIARSKALSKLTQHKAARADAELAIQTEPDNILVLENDAFTLYEQDDFEDALLRYYQGLAKRKKPEYFYNGVKVGDETLQTCIGRKSECMLDQKHLGKTIIDIQYKNYSQNVLTEAETARKKRDSERIDRYFSERYLRRMAEDKTFLLQCLKNPDLSSGNKSHNEQLNIIIKDTLEIIDRRKETLMTRCPVYVLKHEEPTLSKKMQEIKEQEALVSRSGAMKVITRLIDDAEQAKTNQDIENCLAFTDRALSFINSQPKSFFNDKAKNKMNQSIYLIIGQLYFDMKAFIPDFSESLNEQRIQFMLGINITNNRTVEMIKKTVTPTILNIKKFKKDVESKLEVSVEAIERTYLHHELSWCLAAAGQHELARKAAVTGYRIAKKIENRIWCINNAFLVARADINQTNVDEAKHALNEAFKCAKRMQNNECSMFFEKILELVDFPELTEFEELSLGEKRANEIINLMPTQEMRIEAATLLHKMTYLPQNKRMSLLPSGYPSRRMSEFSSRMSTKIHTRAKRQSLMESGSTTKYRSIINKTKVTIDNSKDLYNLPTGI